MALQLLQSKISIDHEKNQNIGGQFRARSVEEKAQYQPPPPFQILKRGDKKKMSACGDLKSSCHEYLPGGLLCFLLKKLLKIKYGLRAQFQILILAWFSQTTN